MGAFKTRPQTSFLTRTSPYNKAQATEPRTRLGKITRKLSCKCLREQTKNEANRSRQHMSDGPVEDRRTVRRGIGHWTGTSHRRSLHVGRSDGRRTRLSSLRQTIAAEGEHTLKVTLHRASNGPTRGGPNCLVCVRQSR